MALFFIMKLKTKTLKITLEEPAKTWFSNFAWGDDKYEYEELPDVMTIDVDLWNDEFSEYSMGLFNNQIQKIIDVDIEGFDMVKI